MTTKPTVALPSAHRLDPAGKPLLDVMPELPQRYGLQLSGSCLEPVLPDGAVALIDSREPYAVGDLVAIWRRPELVCEGEFQAVMKRLVMAPPRWVRFPWRDHPESEVRPIFVVEMLNPPRRFSYRCGDVLAIHKCLGPVPGDMKTRKLCDAEIAARMRKGTSKPGRAAR